MGRLSYSSKNQENCKSLAQRNATSHAHAHSKPNNYISWCFFMICSDSTIINNGLFVQAILYVSLVLME